MKIDAFSAQSQTLFIAAEPRPSDSFPMPAIGNNVRIVVDGLATVFVQIGIDVQSAVVPDLGTPSNVIAVLPGDSVFSIPCDPNLQVSVVTQNDPSNVYISVGEGT